MILISLLEILIVLGMASNQIFAGVVILLAVVIGVIKKEVTGLIGWITFIAMIGVASSIVITQWTIDIPVIAGFIAILGAGIGQLIIMTDQLFKEKGKHLDERRKVAMHMIWSSAANNCVCNDSSYIGWNWIIERFRNSNNYWSIYWYINYKACICSNYRKIKEKRISLDFNFFCI